jgi:sacsin
VLFKPNGDPKTETTQFERTTLNRYPEGTAVLKELLQNADDAGASEVKLVYDLRSHSTDNLLYPGRWFPPWILDLNVQSPV